MRHASPTMTGYLAMQVGRRSSRSGRTADVTVKLKSGELQSSQLSTESLYETSGRRSFEQSTPASNCRLLLDVISADSWLLTDKNDNDAVVVRLG